MNILAIEARRRIEKNLKTQNKALNLSKWISGTEEDIELLAQCTHLKTLYLREGYLQSLAFLKRMPYLEKLDLQDGYGYTSKVDFQDLKYLPQLKELNLYHNYIKDISFLKQLTQLQKLNIGYNYIQDYAPLRHLIQLKSLNISNNYQEYQVQDISLLANLVQLQELYLQSNGIEDISVLNSLSKLQKVNLKNNPIQNINTLQGLVNLTHLDITFDLSEPPPVWYIQLKIKGGKLGNHLHTPEPLYLEKIWQLLKTKDSKNMALAHQLALGQGWSEAEFLMYQNFL